MARADKSPRLNVRYFDDSLVLSGGYAWTYMQIPLVPYEFLSREAREDLCARVTMGLSQLVTNSQDPVDVHLKVTHRPFDAREWETGLREKTRQWQPAPVWDDYVSRMRQRVEQIGFTDKQVFLGVCLGPRTGVGSPRGGNRKGIVGDVFGPLTRLVKGAEKASGLEDAVIPDWELEHWWKSAENIRRILSQSSLRAMGVSSESVAELIMRPLWPGMEPPPPSATPARRWGPGQIHRLVEGVATNHYKYVEVHQPTANGPTDRGYAATLAVSRFPDVLHFPDQEPWMHFAESLLIPADFSTRMSVVPAQRVQKDVGKKLADAKDQAQHIAESGTAVPLKVREQLDVATVLEYQIDKDRSPWAYARHHITVTGTDPDQITQQAKTLIEKYRELGIDLAWPSGEQLDLLLESVPGDKVRSHAYQQRQELSVVAGGMPMASSDCGDNPGDSADQKGWVGPYLGATNSRVLQPVFFSPHVAMTRNYPPGVAITGAPGGGKTFLAFNLAYQMAASGVWTVYIDPKADAKPMGELPGLGNPRVFDLRDGNDGMLDPFSLGSNKSESSLLALETLRLLLGGSVSEEREEALLNAIEQVVQTPQPSLGAVVDVLTANTTSSSARNLGAVLRTIRELPFARLCFSPIGSTQLRPEDGLTVVTLLGLDLPNASTQPEDYSYENRLAVSVMYLLTRYARQLMLNMNKNYPKAICIDEAWAITSTPQGAKLIPEIARMGRSHNTALVLVSQNAGDLMAESVTNSLSTKFAFRSTIPAEVDSVLELMGLSHEEGFQGYIRGLETGQCLMQDVDGRVAAIQIDNWDKELMRAFDTNPETRGKKE